LIVRWPLFCAFAIVVAAGVPPPLGKASSPGGVGPPEPWIQRLNATYRQGEESCDITFFLEVVEYYASGGYANVQERVLDWLETFDQRLPLPDARLAYASILSRVTEPRLLQRTKQLVGLLELRSADLIVRRRIYLGAVAARFGHMPNGALISDISALQEAAYDGVVEVAPSLQRMTERSSDAWRSEQLSPFAEVTMWYLTLRSGATDREDARRIHLSRLLAMPVQEFHEAMIGNRSFCLATVGTIDDTCYRARSQHCSLAAALCDRWDAYLHQLPESEGIEVVTAGPVAQPVHVGQVLANLRKLIAGRSE
jgi:hypothetical protein